MEGWRSSCLGRLYSQPCKSANEYFNNNYLTAGAGTLAGAADFGAFAVNSFKAFCTVKVRPHAVGATTINHAAAISSGEDFVPVTFAIVFLRIPTRNCLAAASSLAAAIL